MSGRGRDGGRGRGRSNEGDGRGAGSYGGRGDGGRGRGDDVDSKRHMGNIDSLNNLHRTIRQEDINAILYPSKSDLETRSSRLNPSSPSQTESSIVLPSLASWRNDRSIGARIDPSLGVVTSNYFSVNRSSMGMLYIYAVHIYPLDKSGKRKGEESAKINAEVSSRLLSQLVRSHPEWNIGRGAGFSYDGKSQAYASISLQLPTRNPMNQPMISETISLRATQAFTVSLTLVGEVNASTAAAISPRAIAALDVTLFQFARAMVIDDNPRWYLVGSQVFRNEDPIRITDTYMALRGYGASLRSCLAGLCLVCDMTVACFLSGGPVTDLLFYASDMRSREDFFAQCQRGLSEHMITKINDVIKNSKVIVTHISQKRSIKGLAPRGVTSASYVFEHNGKRLSIAQYFKETYGITLRFPNLPAINIGGTAERPILIPPELLMVLGGQCRNKANEPQISSTMIRSSAVPPNERMNKIIGPESLLHVLRSDETTKCFGLSNISMEPIDVSTRLLPSPTMQFANGQVTAGLTGEYSFLDKKVFLPPPGIGEGFRFGVAIVSNSNQNRADPEVINRFLQTIVQDSTSMGFRLINQGAPVFTTIRDLTAKLDQNMRFYFVVMMEDALYGEIKRRTLGESKAMMTSCLRYRKLEKLPKGYTRNVLFKLNAKLGGVTCSVQKRQIGTASLSGLGYLFNRPCMLVGMDVSHAGIGSSKESIAAVVASMDSNAAQYATYVTAQTAREEMITALRDAMVNLFQKFRTRNGTFPETIVIYRDGVSESQYDKVVNIEIQSVIEARKQLNINESAKIIALVCQKRHRTRLLFKERKGDSKPYINPCPGLVLDAVTNGGASIVSADYNEFIINSHVAIQGTASPCKYTLVYDEKGMKTAELELLTYWTTYLYGRVNKSVSYATPAYYAHWASKFGRELFNAGCSETELIAISQRTSFMFFI